MARLPTSRDRGTTRLIPKLRGRNSVQEGGAAKAMTDGGVHLFAGRGAKIKTVVMCLGKKGGS